MLLGNLYTIYSVKIIVPKELARNCGVNFLSKTSETWQEVCHIDTKEKQRYPKNSQATKSLLKLRDARFRMLFTRLKIAYFSSLACACYTQVTKPCSRFWKVLYIRSDKQTRQNKCVFYYEAKKFTKKFQKDDCSLTDSYLYIIIVKISLKNP